MFAVQLYNLQKRYHIEYKKRISLKEKFLDLFKGSKSNSEFWAIKGISLTVKKGETVGIIGANGSGKTTLLKLLCGVTKPTRGFIKVNGRIAGLLELGAGFQGDLTGRENIYLNGSILGFSRKEVQKNIDSIIDFAGIGDFIDVPVRTYSTGMYLRLGFSITTQLDSDILLIDEVLTVGDLEFQERCFQKVEEFKNRNKTILLISQNMDMIKKLCDRAILLNRGEIKSIGKVEKVINDYLEK